MFKRQKVYLRHGESNPELVSSARDMSRSLRVTDVSHYTMPDGWYDLDLGFQEYKGLESLHLKIGLTHLTHLLRLGTLLQ
jgi:hypothetical protein